MSGAVVLAAGAGVRLGGVAKALLPAGNGKTFLEAIVDTGRAAGVRDFVVVVGPPFAGEVTPEATRLGATVVENPAPERGMGSSVAVGFAAATAHIAGDVALLWPVDIPFVQAATVTALLAEPSRSTAVVPTFDGRSGHPARIPRALWAELETAGGLPEGARTVLSRHEKIRLAVVDPAILVDVDTREDLP